MLENTAYYRLRREAMPKMKRVAAVTVMALSSALAYLSGVTAPSPFCALFAALAAASLAALIYMYRSPVFFISPALAAALVYIVSGSLLSASFSLIHLPVAFAAALSAYKKYSKSRTVITAACAAGISIALIAAALRIFDPGSLPAYDGIYSSLRDFFISIGINTREGRTALFTEEAASGLASYIMLSLPAAFIMIVSVSSYVATLAFELLMRLFCFGEYIPFGGRWVYTPAFVTAVIYLLSYFVSAALVGYPKADVIGFAAENMLLALLPAMLFTGERALYSLSVRHDRKILFVSLSIILIMLSPSLYLMTVSFSGALSVILTPIVPRVKRLLKSMRGDDDDVDDDYDGGGE